MFGLPLRYAVVCALRVRQSGLWPGAWEMSADIPACKACGGMGEVFTPWDPYEGEDWTECGECDGYGIALAPESRRHYSALLEESKRVGWPAFFQRDLTLHDRNSLAERDPSESFAWVLRESGTHIVFPGEWKRTHAWTGDQLPRSEWRSGVDAGLTILADGGSGSTHRRYWWNGRTLREVALDDLVSLYRDACGDGQEMQVA